MTDKDRVNAAVAEILSEVRALGSERNRAGMARYGINVDRTFGRR